MDAIAAVVLGGTSMSGGKGSISGTVIGVIVIGILKNGMNLLGIDSSWQYVVQGICNTHSRIHRLYQVGRVRVICI